MGGLLHAAAQCPKSAGLWLTCMLGFVLIHICGVFTCGELACAGRMGQSPTHCCALLRRAVRGRAGGQSWQRQKGRDSAQQWQLCSATLRLGGLCQARMAWGTTLTARSTFKVQCCYATGCFYRLRRFGRIASQDLQDALLL